jgi:hypothetical protein
VDPRAPQPGYVAPKRAGSRRRAAGLITARDRELLGFAAKHRFILPAHVQALLGVSAAAAYARLRTLCQIGLLKREQKFHREPACYLVTRAGLAVAGSELPRPRLDLRCYDHDIGVAWLWLAAHSGAFGSLREVISERQLRSADARAQPGQRPLAVRLGGSGPGGRERLHYPDLLLVDAAGQKVAIELELTAKGRSRREKILSGYAADPGVAAVLYLVRDNATERSIATSARKLGISARVHVQRVQLQGVGAASEAGIAAQRTRLAGHEQGHRFSPDRSPAGGEVGR